MSRLVGAVVTHSSDDIRRAVASHEHWHTNLDVDRRLASLVKRFGHHPLIVARTPPLQHRHQRR